ncbi:MAG TPA: FMN-binding protein [Candidatus Paceibacterota bacterium]|nr:FMN-binding protein [Candidatus Paceibacterota bacterium]
MKKFALSFLVVVTFGFYALIQKSNTTPEPVVVNDRSAITIKPIENSTDITSSQEPNTNADVIPTPVIQPTKQPQSTIQTPIAKPAVKPKPASGWNDGAFLGSDEDAYYDHLQVKAVISGGKLSDVVFVYYPKDNPTSARKSAHATPILKSEAIASQSANVNTVSGATYTSEAFMRSLASALAQAKA